MALKTDIVNLEKLTEIWEANHGRLHWPAVFVLPAWLESWWSSLADSTQPMVMAVYDDEQPIGLAPLMTNDGVASFIGDPDVCDNQDFIVAQGREREFLNAVLDELINRSMIRLNLARLRPDSTAAGLLLELARERGLAVEVEPVGVSLETKLPGQWDDYLAGLSKKRRHEVRRKMRRLSEAGQVRFSCAQTPDQVAEAGPIFMDLFRKSRTDKEQFMTPARESFFNSLISSTARAGILRLFTLVINDQPAATSLCFDHNQTRYLYNNGYDPGFKSLSVGMLCKVLSLKDAIENRLDRYDFLNGDEPYKYRLGGHEVELIGGSIILQSGGDR